MDELKPLTPPGAHPALMAASDYGLACNLMARHKLGTPEYDAAYRQCNEAWERIAAACGVLESDWLDEAMKLAENYARAWQHDVDGSYVIKEQAVKAKAALRAHLAGAKVLDVTSMQFKLIDAMRALEHAAASAAPADAKAYRHRALQLAEITSALTPGVKEPTKEGRD